MKPENFLQKFYTIPQLADDYNYDQEIQIIENRIKILQSLVALKALPQDELDELWSRYFNSGKPQLKPLWWKIQCDLSGAKLAQKYITKLNLYSVDPNKCVANANNTKYHIKPGTRLSKKFKGTEHVVTVVAPDQFEYLGTTHKTLSAIATLIYGHKVSGYDFFGFNNKK